MGNFCWKFNESFEVCRIQVLAYFFSHRRCFFAAPLNTYFLTSIFQNPAFDIQKTKNIVLVCIVISIFWNQTSKRPVAPLPLTFQHLTSKRPRILYLSADFFNERVSSNQKKRLTKVGCRWSLTIVFRCASRWSSTIVFRCAIWTNVDLVFCFRPSPTNFLS